MEDKKKTWTRPQLIVLERGQPEERVLAFCKHPQSGPGPNSINCVVAGGRCLQIGQS